MECGEQGRADECVTGRSRYERGSESLLLSDLLGRRMVRMLLTKSDAGFTRLGARQPAACVGKADDNSGFAPTDEAHCHSRPGCADSVGVRSAQASPRQAVSPCVTAETRFLARSSGLSSVGAICGASCPRGEAFWAVEMTRQREYGRIELEQKQGVTC